MVQIPLDELARAAFFSHYVWGLARTYDVLERIGNQSPVDKHLTASIDAVSLAFFSFQHYSSRALKSALEKYLSALPSVNEALRSSESLASDSTLLAVLLLDLFEKITNTNPRSSEAWMSHVKGALALCKFRAGHQFETYVGRRLSVRLFTNMLISCVAANTPVPPALLRLRQDLEQHVNKDDPKWQVSGLVIKYVNLRGAIESGSLSTLNIIRQVKDLDHEFQSLAGGMPPSWTCQRISVERPSDHILENHYDVYPDFFTAQTCNVIRVMRILLNDTTRTAYRDIAPRGDKTSLNSPNALLASQIIDDMAKEICASGPQFTGIESFSAKPANRVSPTRKMHGYTLLFPFYVAAMYASPESKVQPWVVGQLRTMSSNLEMKNARLVADVLERADGTSPWSVFAMLGSYAFAA